MKHQKEASWKDSAEVEDDTCSIVACSIPVPLASSGAVDEAAWRGAGELEIPQPEEGEAEHCGGDDDDFCSVSEAATGLRKEIVHK